MIFYLTNFCIVVNMKIKESYDINKAVYIIHIVFMKAYSDEKLVLEAQQGNENAFNELYDRYHKRLEYVAMKLCKNNEDAKDAVQQTFIQVHTSLANLREADRFYHWCCKIIHGKCTDMFRKNKDVAIDIENSVITSMMIEERDEYLPQNQIHFKSDRDVLLSMIDQLPLQQKQVVLLVYFEQLSMQDCAFILDVPEGTVKSRLFTAKKTLKNMITKYNENNEDAPLNFKSATLSAVLSAALIYDFKHLFPISVPVFRGHHHISANSLVNIALGAACCITIGSAVYAFNSNSGNTEADITNNESVIYQNRIVNSSKEAYFLLRNWAVDERQMRNRNHDEIMEAKKLYEYLQTNDDEYYAVLVKDGWTIDFEALLK